MFGDIGWAEMLMIGVVALIVIGPQDLPDMFRQLGRFTAKLRQMSREFSRAMEQAASASGVKDVARDVSSMTNPKSMGLDAVKSAADRFEKWDPLKNAATPTKPIVSQTIKGPTPPEGSIAAPPAPAAPVTAAAAPPVEPLVPAPAPPGPATQAEFDKKAARASILRETTAKLKAIDAGEAVAEAAAPAKPRTARKKSVPDPAAATPQTKPRAPRKKKADTE